MQVGCNQKTISVNTEIKVMAQYSPKKKKHSPPSQYTYVLLNLLYCKLRTEFFPIDLWPEREAHRPSINEKKQESVTYSTN